MMFDRFFDTCLGRFWDDLSPAGTLIFAFSPACRAIFHIFTILEKLSFFINFGMPF